MTRDIETEIFFDAPDDEAPSGPPPRAGRPGSMAPTLALPLLLLQEALTPSQTRRIRKARCLCVLVHAPSPAWVQPLRNALDHLGDWSHIEARDGTSGYRKRPEDGVADLVARIGAGQRVAAISHDPATLLPSCLVACADIRVVLHQPSDRVVRQSIGVVTGTMPRRVPPRAGLDFGDLASCIRLGDVASAAARRLELASRARSAVDRVAGDIPDVRDLHGYGAATDWANRLLADLAEWRAGQLPFDRISRTLLLASDPGLGKSTWVRSLARTANLPLVSFSISQLFSTGPGYLSDVVARVAEIFRQASQVAPALIFFDEMDALPNREDIDSRAKDYWTPLITQFLLLLDDSISSASARLIVVGATNFVDRVDPALRRPGRLHPTIRIERPDAQALAAIMRQHLGADLSGADLSGIAALATGATGADVVAWVRDARRAARVGNRAMSLADLRDCVAPADTRSEDERWRAAVHEGGHAVVATLTGAGRVTHVDIVPVDGRGGRTCTRPTGPATPSRADLEALAVIMLAGRAAEVVFGLAATAGASDDLCQATGLVAALHASYGLGESLAHRATPADVRQLLAYDPVLRACVDVHLNELYGRALAAAKRDRVRIAAVARVLMRERVLDEAAFALLMATEPTPAARSGRGGPAGPGGVPRQGPRGKSRP